MSETSHSHNTSGIMCSHVLKNERPLNFVRHCPDGTFDFMCGEWDHDNIDDAAVVCATCASAKISGGLQLSDIPVGNYAERPSADARWVVHPMTEEEITEYLADDE